MRQGLYLWHQLREVLGDDGKGSATHSKVIALFLLGLTLHTCTLFFQVDLYRLEKMSQLSL